MLLGTLHFCIHWIKEMCTTAILRHVMSFVQRVSLQSHKFIFFPHKILFFLPSLISFLTLEEEGWEGAVGGGIDRRLLAAAHAGVVHELHQSARLRSAERHDRFD